MKEVKKLERGCEMELRNLVELCWDSVKLFVEIH